ncbi:MAG: class I SAM-dependent methyltransferase [Caldilineae bacterium]|nr:MAG: class I SAM-dependent methyltransferase [Caldilineae bacterium]
MSEHKRRVQQQFGTEEALSGYSTSDVHARGESLDVLAEQIAPRPDWLALDVGTGAGHTAHRFAPHVARVIATDLTPAMVRRAAHLSRRRSLSNVQAALADAEALPFANASFDLLTCRLAFHHFPHPRRALAEFARVLKPGGVLGFTDNITLPDRQAAGFYNAFEKLRDPSHNWVYPAVRLEAMLRQAGFRLRSTHRLRKELEFHAWADRQNVSPANKTRLLAMLDNLPEALVSFLSPRRTADTCYFTLHEVVVVGEKF